MSKTFKYFVVFAEMRTGSNFLEENINAFPSLKCWGEAFNPSFVGKSNWTEMAGVSQSERDKDPHKLLDAMREHTDGLAGFRFFHNHDPRILEHVLQDKDCAKIILTRNPLESYVSLKIANATNQWRLTDMKHAKKSKAHFDLAEFHNVLANTKAFQLTIQEQLQKSGQTGFYINYEDIQNVDVINGLAQYLGAKGEMDATKKTTKVQNPSHLSEKVENYDEMVKSLNEIDHFNLGNTPNFEPRRGASVPSFVAAASSKLLYMPVMGGPESSITQWLADIDDVTQNDLLRDFTQKTLRQWKRNNKNHRSFTVISHPVTRLYRVFCNKILSTQSGAYTEIRKILQSSYNVPLPENESDASYSLDAHRKAFMEFTRFVAGNLNGQTSVRVDPAWASQSEVINGFSNFALPDVILREDDLLGQHEWIKKALAIKSKKAIVINEPTTRYELADIYDAEVEKAVKLAYQKDYMAFGFTPLKI